MRGVSTIGLKDLIEDLTSEHLVILDIDSTLLTTFQRNQAILEAFCEALSTDYPTDIAQLLKVRCQLGDYGLTTGLDRQGVTFSSDQVRHDLFEFWKRNFFSSSFLHCDQPVEGAVEFAQKLNKQNIPLMYLTARHWAPMFEGSQKSLLQLGFPLDASIPLVLKKDLSQSDAQYKSNVVKELLEKYRKIVFIDNEPVVLQQIHRDHPSVELIWMDSTHSGKADPPEMARTIVNFIL